MKIVIVGGGSSGWMTAAAIAYKHPTIDLTLIESEELGTIGVGESTLGHINRFFHLLDLKDTDWMAECDATYKVSIKFEDFWKKGEAFQYPFGKITTPCGKEAQDFFVSRAMFPDELKTTDFAKIFSLNTHLADSNTIPPDNIPNQGFYKDHMAYHMDAIKLAKYLKNRYCQNITHILDTVENVDTDYIGVCGLDLKQGDRIEGDLYIDCSGFASILLDKALKVKHHSFPYLLTDSAVAARIPRKDKTNINNYTNCKGLSSGWVWDIPLWNRSGKGYVYSSKFQTSEDAEAEFRKETEWDGEINHIKFRQGYHEKAWYKNVVGIGLSYAFIEPLESSGLMTTHENIIELCGVLKRAKGNITSIDKHMYNTVVGNLTQKFSGFVALHYGLSRRNDTPFWKYVTQEIEYDVEDVSIVREDNTTRELSYMYGNQYYNAEHDGLLYIAAGTDFNIINSEQIYWLNHQGHYTDDTQRSTIKNLKEIISNRKDMVKTLPSHFKYLCTEIYRAKRDD